MITPSFSLTATERVLPKLALDFTTASLDPRVTFTRTTSATNPATYVNSDGLVTLATNNQPRFDYDPVTRVCKGLLIEESRTNIIKYSEDFTQTSAWVKDTYITVTPNAATAPDGTQTADLIDSIGYYQAIRQSFVATSTSHTFSVYHKAGATNGAFWWFSNSSEQYIGSNVSIQKIYGSGSVSVSGPNLYIVGLDSNWTKIALTITGLTVGTTYKVGSFVGAPSGGAMAGNVYFWGAQLEAGTFPTSYIPTTTTALTRNADVATMTGTNFSDWYNATQGSLVFVGDLYAPTTSASLVEINGATTADRAGLLYGYPSASQATAFNLKGGSAFASQTTISANTQFKASSSFVTNSTNVSLNAQSTTSSGTAVSMPTATKLSIGYNGVVSSGWMSGHVAKIFYYPQKLTNAELQAFSK